MLAKGEVMQRPANLVFSVVVSALVALGLVGCSDQPKDLAETNGNSIEQPAQAHPASELTAALATDLGTDFEMASTLSPGGQLYTKICASCHEQGLNRAPHRSMLLLMSPGSIYRAMTKGVMQAQSSAMSDADKVAVAEFLARRPMSDELASTQPPQCVGEAAAFDYGEPPIFTGWGLTPASTHAITVETAGLNKQNIGTLKLKWAFAYPGALRARSAPALAGGALYVGSHGGTVYAFDRETGCVRWTFDASAEVRTGVVISPWQAGDKSAEPLIYFGDLIGNLYALDALTGAVRWRVRPDEHPNTTLTATPSLHEGILYQPVSSLEVVPASEPDYECCKFRGSVVAYDARTGEQKWQTFTVAEVPSPRGLNSAGTQNYGPSGAPIWNSPAIDAKRGQLTVGSGENYSSPADGGSDAIFALDLLTGGVNWVFQATVGDAWNTACGEGDRTNCPVEDGPDFDFGAGTLLARDDNGREYVVGGQKSGMVHALDPDTGELIWQTKVGRGGVHAGVYFGLAATQGRVIVPISDTPDGRTYAEPARPGMYALDLRNGEYVWQTPANNVCRDDQRYCNPGYGAAITTTPEIVIAGSIDGHLRMFDVETGKVLWDFDAAKDFPSVGGGTAQGGSFGGGSAPLVYNGQLIVNSGYGFSGKMPGNALLVFEVE
jgi:polyvinyl alcohol dehydrogenase (cytochrome)